MILKMDETVSYTDFMCPICLQLLIRPVVLPCKHELCMPCFQNHVEATSLCCPMCRIRISNWARKKGREGALVDESRWALIQKLFPDRCERRLRGEDDDDDDNPLLGTNVSQIVAKEGDLRKEYEQELIKAELEKEEELKASEEFAKKLQEEEKQIEDKLKEDEDIARQLQRKELEQAGGDASALNSKLVQFLDVCKLPKEMALRSSKSQKDDSDNDQKSKSKRCLTNWLSKASQGSDFPGSATDYQPTASKTARQEQEDYRLAFRVQKELDKESRQRLSPITLNRHFYPLRHEKGKK